jgi:hypothetical protein
MVAPGILVTTARCLRNESAPGATPHEGLRVIRAPDIGKKPEPAVVLASDDRLDRALLRIDSPRSSACVRLLDAPVAVGTHCGTAGFPRILIEGAPSSGISLVELFQGADISSYTDSANRNGCPNARYETDSPLYGDASGSPGFIETGEVFGMCHFPPGTPPADVTFWIPSMSILSLLKEKGIRG